MTPQEIVEALRCCSTKGQPCDTCPYDNGDELDLETCFKLEQDAADLIESLQSENEKLSLKLATIGDERHGEWCKRFFASRLINHYCLKCFKTSETNTNYCPNCGCKMGAK